MKKTILAILTIIVFSYASCEKDCPACPEVLPPVADTCEQYDLTAGAKTISGSSIGQNGTVNGEIYISNFSSVATTGNIEVVVSPFLHGTTTFPNLPTGVTQLTTSGALSLLISNSINPGLANRVTIPFTYVNNAPYTGVLFSHVMVISRENGDPVASNNQAATFLQIN